MAIWNVYFLFSINTGRYYIGVTQNIDKRIVKHNSGSVKSTKPYRPWRLIYKESYTDKMLAYKREWFLKHPKGFLEKKRLIENIFKN